MQEAHDVVKGMEERQVLPEMQLLRREHPPHEGTGEPLHLRKPDQVSAVCAFAQVGAHGEGQQIRTVHHLRQRAYGKAGSDLDQNLNACLPLYEMLGSQ